MRTKTKAIILMVLVFVFFCVYPRGGFRQYTEDSPKEKRYKFINKTIDEGDLTTDKGRRAIAEALIKENR